MKNPNITDSVSKKINEAEELIKIGRVNFTNLNEIPAIKETANPTISPKLESLLLQMAEDAESGRESRIPEHLYKKYKTFQGIRAALRSVIEDTEQEATLRLNLHNYLVHLPKNNTVMYLDNCRRTLKQLKKARTEQGLVFTETRQIQIEQILGIIEQERQHVIIDGATGLGKTVLAEQAVKEYLKKTGKGELVKQVISEYEESADTGGDKSESKDLILSDDCIMINASAATFEQIFGQIHIKPDKESKSPTTKLIPGIVYLAAEKGLPVILEEYNKVKDTRILTGMQTLMSAFSNTRITLEKGLSVTPSQGFTLILTGNPKSKGSEHMIGIKEDDTAISSRCIRMKADQLPLNELLQQFLISESLLDDNLGVRLPEGVYDQIIQLATVSIKTYQDNILKSDQMDAAGINTNNIQSNLLSQRKLNYIIKNWKKNQYVDSIEDIILKVYLSESANVVEKEQELKLLYTLFYLEGFFSDKKYPQVGDGRLGHKLSKLISEIDLSPIEKRKRSNIELTTASLVEGFNAMIKGTLPKKGEQEYTPFTSVFKDCFGAMPKNKSDLAKEGITLDSDKLAYFNNLIQPLLADDECHMVFQLTIGNFPTHKGGNKDVNWLIRHVQYYNQNPGELENMYPSNQEVLKHIQAAFAQIEYSNQLEFESLDNSGSGQLNAQQATSELAKLFTRI